MAVPEHKRRKTASDTNKNQPTGMTADQIKKLAYKKFSDLKLTAPSLQAHKEAIAGVFSMTPKKITAYLNKYIISQDRAKEDIAIALAYHYKRISNTKLNPGNKKRIIKNNILLIGPTGVGKTYILQVLSDLIKVPFVEVDITKYTQTGYQGSSLEDLLKYVLIEAGGDEELAQRAIIYLDETDKLNEQNPAGGERDINGRAVQNELLKIMEGTIVPLAIKSEGRIVPLDTRNMLFVCSGAFPKLEEMVKKAMTGEKTMGFGGALPSYKDSEILLKAPREKLIEGIVKYGFLPEFVGRLPVITVLSPLTKQEIRRILVEPEDSIIKNYQSESKLFGTDLLFTDEALDMIAERAYGLGTGARSLQTICESMLRRYKYELPDAGLQKVVITKNALLNPDEELRRILNKDGPNE